MEQAFLRDWEQRCIQEEPPFCQAACPLRVDARGMLALAAAGKWKEARAAMARAMPLPGVLGLLCDHPCQEQCRRKDVDESIRIGDLERAILRLHPEPETIRPLPPREIRVGILGGGLSALVCAWDLGRKGYAPVVHVPAGQMGGRLFAYAASRLPAGLPEDSLDQALTQALAQLGGLRATFQELPALDQASARDALADLTARFPAVYVDLETVPFSDLPGPARADATTLQAGETVFAGAAPSGAEGVYSPMAAAFAGRKAASSLDRFLQKVSLTAARDNEGPMATRLFTSIEGVAAQPAVQPSHPEGFDDAEAMREAGRCLQCQCLECVKVCDYLAMYKGYPKKYARGVYNNLSIVHGVRQANRQINGCSGCGLCAEVCPNDVHMGEFCLAARQEMVATNKMPPSAHDFALRDFEQSVSPAAALARHAPGTAASRWLFLPGCQLTGSSPAMAGRVYAHLRERLGDAGLLLTCCGAPAHWAGRAERFATHLDHLRITLREMGSPRLILACATCAATFAEHLPEADAVTLWEALDEHPPALAPDAWSGVAFSLHDPCSSRHLPQARRAARRLASRCGLVISEPVLSGERTECCGFGGGMEAAHPQLADTVARRRAARCQGDVLAWCAMCRDSLSRSGKTVRHLLDFLFPEAADGPDVAGCSFIRRAPGFADRQEQRARFRRHVLETVWGEAPAGEDDGMVLRFDPGVEAALDARRILVSDIRAAIRHGRSGGAVLVHDATGRRLAVHAPAAVTYWVEYSEEGDGVRVHRAWSHRMTLTEG